MVRHFYRDGQGAFPPWVAIETSWNGSLGSLCMDNYLKAEQSELRQPYHNVADYPRDDRQQDVTHTKGKNHANGA